MIKVYKPQNKQPVPFLSHAGDTFRELVDLWGKKGLVEVIDTIAAPLPSQNENEKENETVMVDKSGLVWLNDIGDVLLYDRPNFDWIPKDITMNCGLFANSPPPKISISGKNVSTFPWIFWGRNPEMLENKSNELSKTYEQRTISSIFVGNIENEVQNKFRANKGWSEVVSLFEIKSGKEHKYTHSEYLDLLSNSKFGLCLRGYGPKCNREIELMALGVVPLITDDVDTTYFDRLIEGLHYFRVQTPNDVTNFVNNVTKERWQLMSDACKNWYRRNATVTGSFETTMRILGRESQKERTVSISTMASNTCWDDLQLMLYSLYQFHPKMTVFITCDDVIENNLVDWVKNNTPTLGVITIPTLTEYSNLNRKDMEKSGKWLEFMLRKCDSVDKSFEEKFDCTLFVDCDMVFLNEINFADFKINEQNIYSGIGRSKHECKAENHKMYGTYNGGFLWIDRPGFTDWWKLMSKVNSRFYEQAPLEDINKFYETFDVPIQYNFGWWRLYECEPHQVQQRELNFRVQNGVIYYDDMPLRTIHTHFGDKTFIHTVRFNMYMKKLFVAVKDTKVLNVIKAIENLFYLNMPLTPLSDANAPNTLDTLEIPNTSAVDTNTQIMNAQLNEPDNKEINTITAPSGIDVILPYYIDKDVNRQAEYNYCIQSNLENEHVNSVHILFRDGQDIVVPEWLRNHSKFVGAKFVGGGEQTKNKWLTYKELVEYANLKLRNRVVGILHLDVFLGHSKNWDTVSDFINKNIVLCLGRYEFDGKDEAKKDEKLKSSAFCSTQDAWIFRSPITIDTSRLNFEVGKRWADNAFAHRLVTSNYTPYNDTKMFPILHYDLVNKSNKTHPGHSHGSNDGGYPFDGYYFVPDQTVTSVDSLIQMMGISDLDKYQIICGILSKYSTV